MKGYFKYIRPHILFFIFGPIFMITEVIGEVLMPRLLSLIIDSGIITGNMSGDSAYIIKIGISMVCVALMMMLGGVLGNYFAVRASVGFASDLRADLFRHFQTFSFKNIDGFYQQAYNTISELCRYYFQEAVAMQKNVHDVMNMIQELDI